MANIDKQPVIFEDLGSMPYQAAWDYQEKLLKENVQKKAEARNRMPVPVGDDHAPITIDYSQLTTHHLLFVEHPPVYTLGKSGDMANVLISEEERAARNIEFFASNRGATLPSMALSNWSAIPFSTWNDSIQILANTCVTSKKYSF